MKKEKGQNTKHHTLDIHSSCRLSASHSIPSPVYSNDSNPDSRFPDSSADMTMDSPHEYQSARDTGKHSHNWVGAPTHGDCRCKWARKLVAVRRLVWLRQYRLQVHTTGFAAHASWEDREADRPQTMPSPCTIGRIE